MKLMKMKMQIWKIGKGNTIRSYEFHALNIYVIV